MFFLQSLFSVALLELGLDQSSHLKGFFAMVGCGTKGVGIFNSALDKLYTEPRFIGIFTEVIAELP